MTRAGGEVAVDRTGGPEDLDLAVVGELEHPEPGMLELEAKAQDVSEEGDGRFGVVGPGTQPGQLDDPHGQTPTPNSGSASPAQACVITAAELCKAAFLQVVVDCRPQSNVLFVAALHRPCQPRSIVIASSKGTIDVPPRSRPIISQRGTPVWGPSLP